MSFLNKIVSKDSRAAEVYLSNDTELLLPDSRAPQSTYGSLGSLMSRKSKVSSLTETPLKVLAALLVMVLVGRVFMSWHAAHETESEIEDLRQRLENVQEPKCEGYRKAADTSCGGEPILTAGEGASDLGCKAIRKPITVDDLARHGIINATSMQDRAANLLDGTDSEWWSGKDSATLTVDILRESHVKQLRLQWWGLSYADEVTVSASLDGSTWTQVRQVYNYADVADDCPKRKARGDCVVEPEQSKKYCRRTCYQAEEEARLKKVDGTSSRHLTNAAPTMNGWTELAGWTSETRYLKIDLNHGHDDPWKMHEKLGLRRIEVLGSAMWEPCAALGQPCKCFGAARIWQPSTKTWISVSSGGTLTCTGKAFGIPLGRSTGECQCWPAATEQEALEQCRGQCDALGEQCSAFEYSYNTNIHQKKLGPRCCFRSQVGDASLSLRSVRTNDCYRKDS